MLEVFNGLSSSFKSLLPKLPGSTKSSSKRVLELRKECQTIEERIDSSVEELMRLKEELDAEYVRAHKREYGGGNEVC